LPVGAGVVQVGAAYNDLGATIAAPQSDLNFGIKTYLNGALVSDISLDTSQVAADTIDYVATDENGLTATSTHTVIIGCELLCSDSARKKVKPNNNRNAIAKRSVFNSTC